MLYGAALAEPSARCAGSPRRTAARSRRRRRPARGSKWSARKGRTTVCPCRSPQHVIVAAAIVPGRPSTLAPWRTSRRRRGCATSCRASSWTPRSRCCARICRRARTGAPFLSLELGDRTGRVRAVGFDDVALLDGRFAQGDTVRVLGAVEEYRGRVQVIVRRSSASSPATRSPTSRAPAATRRTWRGSWSSSPARSRDSTLRSLVEAVYADARFRAASAQAPVTIDGHHAVRRRRHPAHDRRRDDLPRGRPAAPAAGRVGARGGGAHVLRRRRRRVPARRGAAARRGGPPARHPAPVAAPGRARGAPAADAARAAAAARALRSRAAARGRPRRPRCRRPSRSTPACRRRRERARTGSTAALDCARAPPGPAPARPDGRRRRGESRPDRGGLCRGGARRSVDLVLAPELAISGYPPEDLLLPHGLPAACRREVEALAGRGRGAAARRRAVARRRSRPQRGRCSSPAAEVRARYDKRGCPTTASSTRSGRSRPAGAGSCSTAGGALCAVTICEDLWLSDGPAGRAARRGATVILNISSSPYHVGKGAVREEMLRTRARDELASSPTEPRRRPGRAASSTAVVAIDADGDSCPGGGVRGGAAGLRGRPGRGGRRPAARHAARGASSSRSTPTSIPPWCSARRPRGPARGVDRGTAREPSRRSVGGTARRPSGT